MPYAEPPTCTMCGKTYPVDTQDVVPLVMPNGTVRMACVRHPGVRDEYLRQENLTGTARTALAKKVVDTDEFRALMHEYLTRTIDELEATVTNGPITQTDEVP